VLARSPAPITTQQPGVRARSAYELNRRNAERARTLFAADVISAAELQKREANTASPPPKCAPLPTNCACWG
jgi:hypothetical protein